MPNDRPPAGIHEAKLDPAMIARYNPHYIANLQDRIRCLEGALKARNQEIKELKGVQWGLTLF